MICSSCRRVALSSIANAPAQAARARLSSTCASSSLLRSRQLRPQQPTGASLSSRPTSAITSTVAGKTPSISSTIGRRYSAAATSSSPASEEAATGSGMTEAEASIAALLSSKLETPVDALVQDVSGGCGSMYAIDVSSPSFRGLSILKQQRLVNAALGDVVKQWHGVQIRTRVPPEDGQGS